ncbi:MAG TPA: hypothetical protein PK674_02400 [Candidatus Absconditabacterales bacterium]|nr:hypothetical protein [Candidatus Absconditabacterales bacterium]HOQ79039.1 hypothetical protein [Candidatus Absconditabacterales bacterium]HPK27641.1 hypothetical protein [Candidatus Absconditabacterales bacterium]
MVALLKLSTNLTTVHTRLIRLTFGKHFFNFQNKQQKQFVDVAKAGFESYRDCGFDFVNFVSRIGGFNGKNSKTQKRRADFIDALFQDFEGRFLILFQK